jgi:hypothetical protein
MCGRKLKIENLCIIDGVTICFYRDKTKFVQIAGSKTPINP